MFSKKRRISGKKSVAMTFIDATNKSSRINPCDMHSTQDLGECDDTSYSKDKTGMDEIQTHPLDRDGLRQRTSRTAKRTYSYSSSVYDEENRKKLLNGEARPDLPCHRANDSHFSTSSGFQNFRGLLNWCVLMLVFTTGRAALENLMKYGILIDPINWYRIVVLSPTNFPALWIVVALGVFVSITFLVEKIAAATSCPEPVITLLHSINLLTEIALPAGLVYHFHPHPFLSAPLLSICVIVFLKLTSYAQVNKWCRLHLRKQQTSPKFRGLSSQTIQNLYNCADNHCVTGSLSGGSTSGDANKELKKGCECVTASQRSMSLRSEESLRNRNCMDDHGLNIPRKLSDSTDLKRYMINAKFQQYPNNLNITDLCYFLLAPTVCYELNFPRTTRIRKRFLMNRALESLFLWGLMLSLIQQWIYPTVENSVEMFQQMNYAMMVDRILKLAIPNHLIWLMAFYWYFHSCCNLMAELMRFGDRMFYKDWWNAENLQQFWSMWNIPIHRFALRHIYKPLLSRGISKTTANMIVFLVSAFFHEYLCSIPLKMFRPWFFVSFSLQVPLVVMSSRLTGKLGNIIMWMMLILGQPVALLMYFHDYYIAHRI